MMHKKLICLDLDGTLLKDDKTISVNTINTIKQVMALGHVVCLLTGRNHNTSIYYYKLLGLNTLMCNLEGCIISNPSTSKEVMTKSTFLENDLQLLDLNKNVFNNQLLQEILTSFKDDLLVSGNYLVDGIKIINHQPTNKITNTLLNELMDYMGLRSTPFYQADFSKAQINSTLADLTSDVYGSLLLLKQEVDVVTFINKIKSRTKTLNVSYWKGYNGYYVLSLTSAFATKKNALRYFSSYYGIELKDCIVFGDSINDIPALSKCAQYDGLSYAMKNGMEAVKAKSNRITTYSNNEDGVAYELKQIFHLQ